jgi:hypothetical protein
MPSENAQPQWDSLVLPVLAGLLIGAGVFLALTRPAGPTAPMIVEDKPLPVASARSAAGVTPFRDCRVARAAGAAPVYAGDPRYGPWLDGDDDGIGCEPYHRR